MCLSRRIGRGVRDRRQEKEAQASVPTSHMGKYFCDYCQSYLTHDSLSVRKNHLHGKHHLRLYNEYYEKVANEHPEYDRKNTDASVGNPLLSEMYKGIPGLTNKYADQHQRDGGAKPAFKLYVPSTSVGLPNPPPNVLFVNYSNYVQKSRVTKPYYSNGNSNGYGHGHDRGHGFGGFNRGGNRGFRPRDREASPRTTAGTSGRGSTDHRQTHRRPAPAAASGTDLGQRNPRSSAPVRTGPHNGYGYGYGYDSKDRPSRPAGGQGYAQARHGQGDVSQQQQPPQRNRQSYQQRYKQGYQRYPGQQDRSRDYY